jgi:hypothetical protein
MNSPPTDVVRMGESTLTLIERRQRLIQRIAIARGETRVAAQGVEQALQQMQTAAYIGQKALGLLKPLVLTAGVAWVLKPGRHGRPRGKFIVALVGLLSVFRTVRRVSSFIAPVLQLINSPRTKHHV